MAKGKKILSEGQSSIDQIETVAKRAKTSYKPDVKATVAIEAIIGELTIAEIADKYEIKTPQNIQQWKEEALKAIYLQFSKPGRKARKSAGVSGKQASRADSILNQASKIWSELGDKDASAAE